MQYVLNVTSINPRIEASISGFILVNLCNCLCSDMLQGTVLCDIILLNFLKGADQYKAKKFEEVFF